MTRISRCMCLPHSAANRPLHVALYLQISPAPCLRPLTAVAGLQHCPVSFVPEMPSGKDNPFEQARALEKKVLRHHDIDAMTDLGFLLLYDDNFVSQRARGVQMMERAIKQAQDPVAMRVLANYQLDNGDGKHDPDAVSLLERSLKLEENPFAFKKLSDCYSSGQGVATDYNVAVQLCERALRLEEHPDIMASLAINLLDAPNLRAQRKRAIAMFERAIHLSSDPKLMNLLGIYYHYGSNNLRPCRRRAAKWYKQAIQTSKHVPSMCNFAYLLLANDPSNGDVQRAVRLLEDAVEEQHQNVDTILNVAEAYSEYGVDYDRALELYEIAAVRFNSDQARSEILRLRVSNFGGVGLDHARTLNYLLDDFKKNKDYDSFITLGAMKWSGANALKMNRSQAIKFLHSYHRWTRWTRHGSFSLMLRHDLSTYPSGEKNGRRFLKKMDENINRCNPSDREAIILSESECEGDKLLALKSFRDQVRRSKSFYEVEWLAIQLRIGRCEIPFDGHLDCITDPLRRFARWRHIASLNLASLLLEMEGKEQEAVAVLEHLMNTMLKLIAVMNLAYILMYKVKGVKRDRPRGMQLLEEVVKETNDVSARAMLANALTEGTECDDCDVERGWELWESVKGEVQDEEELRKIGRLVSTSSEKKWSAFSRGRDDTLEMRSSNSNEGVVPTT